ncbi:DUF1642 domain-containing protein [Streptococcus salivarius]
MDRQEAIDTLSKVGKISVSYAEDLYDSFFPKPVVPQYVADWIKYCKFTNVNLGRALFISDIDFYNYEGQEDCSKLKEFLGTETNQETFVIAWTLGYEVEKEPRYTVRLKGLTSKRSYLNYLIDDDRWYLNDEVSSVAARTQHTRKELEQGGFDEVFDNPMFEVKEVE